jgi:cobalt transporter subunit CbtB
MQQLSITSRQAEIEKVREVSATLQVAGALILGALLLYGVGFTSMEILHNAAHDARHSFSFPCH